MGSRPARQGRRGAGAVSEDDDFTGLVDLASERLGGRVLASSDEFFAPKERVILAEAPVWRDGEYTDRGKWMDGWETRRRRDVLPGEPGFDQAHDWCVIQLGARGRIHGVDVETTHFTGNFPESCALDACVAGRGATAPDLDRASWRNALRAQRPSGRLAQCLSPGSRGRDTRAPAHLSRRRRRAAARLRRRDGGLGRASPSGRDRSGRARARCARRGQQRHVLRPARQPHHAVGPARHGGRLGDQASTHAGARLGGRAAWRARHDHARRGGHAALQGQRPCCVQPRRVHGRGAGGLAGSVAANTAAGRLPPRLRQDVEIVSPAPRTCA